MASTVVVLLLQNFSQLTDTTETITIVQINSDAFAKAFAPTKHTIKQINNVAEP